MTESEAKQRLSDCEVSGHKVFCPVSSKDEGFELSHNEQHEAAFPCWRRHVGYNG